jgi:hypothetical protein
MLTKKAITNKEIAYAHCKYLIYVVCPSSANETSRRFDDTMGRLSSLNRASNVASFFPAYHHNKAVVVRHLLQVILPYTARSCRVMNHAPYCRVSAELVMVQPKGAVL